MQSLAPFLVTPYDSLGYIPVLGDHPTIVIDDETARMIKYARSSLELQNTSVRLYSDGSVLRQHSTNPSIGFACVYETVDSMYRLAVFGRTKGIACSTTAELAGLLATISCCPRNQPATIYADNLSVVNLFSDLVLDPIQASKRSRPPSRFVDWWDVIQRAYVEQGEHIKVEWVPAHNGLPGNEAADEWAALAHNSGLTPWEFNRPGYISTTLSNDITRILGDLRL